MARVVSLLSVNSIGSLYVLSLCGLTCQHPIACSRELPLRRGPKTGLFISAISGGPASGSGSFQGR